MQTHWCAWDLPKIAKHDEGWRDAVYALEQRMLLINENMFADAMTRLRADKFIRARLAEAIACIQNILQTCQYGQFSLRQYLPQIREFLARSVNRTALITQHSSSTH